MSNAIYPTNLPGRAWPRTRTPLWRTTVATTPSGREWRSTAMAAPRYRYTLRYEFLRSKATLQEWQALFGFFNARRGGYDTFLYSDPDDNTVTAQPFGVGDGSTAAFQLVRSLGGFAEPVHDVAAGLAVMVNGAGCNHLGVAGSFQTDTNADGVADGWALISGGTTGTLTPSTGGFTGVTGVGQRLELSGLGTTTSDYGGFASGNVPVAGGATYTFSLSSTANAACIVFLNIRFLDAALGFLSDTFVEVAIATADFRRDSVTAVAPPAAAYCAVTTVVKQRSGAAGPVIWTLDSAQLEIGTAFTAFNTASFSVSATGLVTFHAAPAAAVALTWSGSYYWRCRFEADDLSFDQFMAQFWKTGEVRLVTVKP